MRQSYLSLQFSKVWANLPFYWKSTGTGACHNLLDFIHPVSSWAFWGSESGSWLCTGDKWARSGGFAGDTTSTPEMQLQPLVTNTKVPLVHRLLSSTTDKNKADCCCILYSLGYVDCNFRLTEKQEQLVEL